MDLAKDHFHVNRYTAHGELLSSRGMKRSQFQKVVRDPQRARALWVMESCGTSNYWGRELLSRKDEVKLVPPQFVAKQRVGKNDGNDAAAIFNVHRDTRIHPVPVKSVEQQGRLSVHATRQLLDKHLTATRNDLRSLLAEHGHVTKKGAASLTTLVQEVQELEAAAKLDRRVQLVIVSMNAMLEAIAKQMKLLSEDIKEQVERIYVRDALHLKSA